MISDLYNSDNSLIIIKIVIIYVQHKIMTLRGLVQIYNMYYFLWFWSP